MLQIFASNCNNFESNIQSWERIDFKTKVVLNFTRFMHIGFFKSAIQVTQWWHPITQVEALGYVWVSHEGNLKVRKDFKPHMLVYSYPMYYSLCVHKICLCINLFVVFFTFTQLKQNNQRRRWAMILAFRHCLLHLRKKNQEVITSLPIFLVVLLLL